MVFPLQYCCVEARRRTITSGTIGDFVRIAENEISVAHPDAVKQLLHANLAKVSTVA